MEFPESTTPAAWVKEGVGGDDAADALRYLVATKSRGLVLRKLSGV